MKKAFILFAIITFTACANNPKQPQEANNPAPNLQLNPNGDSELAILMRDMETHWKQVKTQIGKKETIGERPNFASLLTATPTDESMKPPSFDGFAKIYLNEVKALYDTKVTDKTQAYNDIVNACITCHDNSCNGPIPRIKKLLAH